MKTLTGDNHLISRKVRKDVGLLADPMLLGSVPDSRASLPLTLTTLSVMAFGIWLPYSPMASWLGFTELPAMYWPILMLTLLAYMSLTQMTKSGCCGRSGFECKLALLRWRQARA